MIYTPQDWFWVVGDDVSRMWSSAAKAYVPFDPSEYFSEAPTEADVLAALTAAGYPHLGPGYFPRTVAMWQARAALSMAGLIDAANAAVAASGSAEMQAAWEYATEAQFDSPSIQGIAAALSVSQDALKDLFKSAASLQV